MAPRDKINYSVVHDESGVCIKLEDGVEIKISRWNDGPYVTRVTSGNGIVSIQGKEIVVEWAKLGKFSVHDTNLSGSYTNVGNAAK